MTNESIKIVVLGRNYTSILGMIRAVSEITDNIVVIKSVPSLNKSFIKRIKRFILGGDVSEASRYVKKYKYSIEPNREMLFEKILEENESDKNIVVIPTDDFTSSTIDLYLDKFPDNYFMQNIDNQSGKVVELMDKKFQKNIAKKCGLKFAKSWTINCDNGQYNIPEEIVYPVFLKPLISFKGNKEIMKKYNNCEEVKMALDKLPKNIDCSILAEQYIDIDEEYCLLGVSFNGDVLIPGFIKMLESGDGAHKGVTLKGNVKRFTTNELHDKFIEYIKKTKFNGIFDIDYYVSNGVVYFNELNVRFGASGYAITKSGVNLPAIFVSKMFDLNFDSKHVVNELTFINEKVNFEHYLGGFINYKQYNKNFDSVDLYFIYDKNDIKPYKLFQKQLLLYRLINKIKKIVRRGNR